MSFSKKRARAAMLLGLAIAGTTLAVSYLTEKEPNNTADQAQEVRSAQAVKGAISPVGDVDYFAVKGMGAGWGIVAVLDASASDAGNDTAIAAIAPDGASIRAQNTGHWEKGPFIAWSRFTGRDTHYLRVSEKANGATISPYVLRYYALPLGEQPEREPNDSLKTANTSAITNKGVIENVTDVDCYAFNGKAKQKVMVALNADPEDDGGPADFAVELLKKDGSVWARADYSGPGDGEFIDEHTLPEAGVYAYCVRARSGASKKSTYIAGVILDGRYYLPAISYQVKWDNPGPNNTARVGDEMHFTVGITYNSPLPFPGPFEFNVYYDKDCLSVVNDARADKKTAGELQWHFDEVPANLTISKQVTLRAVKTCKGTLDVGYQSGYYVTGTRHSGASFTVEGAE